MGLPGPVRLGVALLAAGLLLDLIAHGPTSSDALATAAHLVVLAGMAWAVFGAIRAGIRGGQAGHAHIDERREP